MLQPIGPAKRVTIVLRSMKEERGGYIRLLELIRDMGGAEATAFQGIASFVGRNPIHMARAVDFIPDIPVVIVWIDRPDTVERILPRVLPLIKNGIVTVDDTAVLLHTSTEIRDLAGTVRVGDVMTRDVVAARLDAPVAELVDDLLEKGLRSVPVVDAEGKVRGIVTNGDLVRRGGLPVRLELLRAMAAEQREVHLAELARSDLTAADVMTVNPVTISESASIRQAATLMLQRQLKRLPVVDEAGRLRGIVSRVDLLATISPPGVQEHQNGVTFPHETAQAPVSRVMNSDVPVVRPDDPVAHLINVVVSTRLNRAVVVDEERRPIGLVSDEELIARVVPEAHPAVLPSLMRRLPLLHGSREAEEVSRHARGRTAKDFMRDRFLVVQRDSSIADTLGQMISGGYKIAVVVDDEGRLVGMTDRRDLLRVLA